MPAEQIEHPRSQNSSYLYLTSTATYGFLSALPLILLYEGLILLANEGRVGEIRISSEVWLKQLLQGVEGPAFLILGGVLLVIGIVIYLLERRKKIPVRPAYFIGIVLESIIYAIVVALMISWTVSLLPLFAPAAQEAPVQPPQGLLMQIALSIGAGIYEELLFRVILVGGLYALLRAVLLFKTPAYLIATVVGALLFSAVHYIGTLGDVFTLQSFVFRFLFGLALNALYLVRGFGVAAWTHALYDVMIVTRFLG